MSKRIQGRKMEGEPAVAKPRSVCLISTSMNRWQSSFFGPDVSNILWNPQLDSGSVKKGAAGNCERDIVQNRVQNPERRQAVSKELREIATGPLPRAPCLTVQGVAGKLQRKTEIQLQTTRLDHLHLQVTDYVHVEKVFTNRTELIDLGTICVDNNKIRNSSWPAI